MIHKRIDKKIQQAFIHKLFLWHTQVDRKLPWVGIKDPYRIWISEVILQQTRVEQGLSYYLKFIKHFPDIYALAGADIDMVLSLWQGLGYYSRARNLHETAKQITQQYGGKVPLQYSELIKLKGIGPYSAAAISSFAAGEPKAVVDGNVVRVLARIFGITNHYQEKSGRNLFFETAQQLLDKNNPGKYNQAIMDFGALQCVPKNPKCRVCTFHRICYAYQNNQVMQFPSAKARAQLKNRYLNFFWIEYRNKMLIEKRRDKDIWKGLYQFPLIETNAVFSFEELLKSPLAKVLFLSKMSLKGPGWIKNQKLSHQEIHFSIYRLSASGSIYRRLEEKYISVAVSDLTLYSLPSTLAFYHNFSLSSKK